MSTKLSAFESGDSQLYYAGGALVQSKTKLMITGLPPTMTSEQMRDFFANYDDSQLVRCQCNNGSGFAIFRSEEAATNAINAGISIGNTPLNMRFAMAMTDNDQASAFISQKSSKFAKSMFQHFFFLSHSSSFVVFSFFFLFFVSIVCTIIFSIRDFRVFFCLHSGVLFVAG